MFFHPRLILSFLAVFILGFISAAGILSVRPKLLELLMPRASTQPFYSSAILNLPACNSNGEGVLDDAEALARLAAFHEAMFPRLRAALNRASDAETRTLFTNEAQRGEAELAFITALYREKFGKVIEMPTDRSFIPPESFPESEAPELLPLLLRGNLEYMGRNLYSYLFASSDPDLRAIAESFTSYQNQTTELILNLGR